MSAELSRLRWLCRRGMKELDVILSRYLEEQYANADGVQQRAFQRLLKLQDPTVYALLLGREQCEDAAINNVLQSIVAAE